MAGFSNRSIWSTIRSATSVALSRMVAISWIFPLGGIAGAILVAGFVAAVMRSHAGEIAGALGSLIGGIVGAGGAVWAVFLLLSHQRLEEAAKVAEAVRTEVATLSKYVIGVIEVCGDIKSGKIKVPRQDANSIMRSVGDPVVYSAVADRVGLLPHPHATVEFYMRLQEAKTMVEMLSTRTDPQGITYVSPPVELVTPAFAGSVADSLITALQLANVIITIENSPSDKALLNTQIQVTAGRHIAECIDLARRIFPDAESFREGPHDNRNAAG